MELQIHTSAYITFSPQFYVLEAPTVMDNLQRFNFIFHYTSLVRQADCCMYVLYIMTTEIRGVRDRMSQYEGGGVEYTYYNILQFPNSLGHESEWVGIGMVR